MDAPADRRKTIAVNLRELKKLYLVLMSVNAQLGVRFYVELRRNFVHFAEHRLMSQRFKNHRLIARATKRH